jgi:hypothetical protein
MSKSRADISNSAIRVFLTKVGKAYDELRGLQPFRGTRKQWEEISVFFGGRCCYCDKRLRDGQATKDHLIPLNKANLGLHAWGNVVPSCRQCNAAKHFRPWQDFLEEVAPRAERRRRTARIRAFLTRYEYDPTLNLSSIARNLYEDVGAVAMTLIDVRYKQAEAAIVTSLRRSRSRRGS